MALAMRALHRAVKSGSHLEAEVNVGGKTRDVCTKRILLYQVDLHDFQKMIFTTIKYFSQVVMGPSRKSLLHFEVK